MREKLTVFTIGHSAHAPTNLVALLRESGIDVVIDVRSVPFSRRSPHFNRESLQQLLGEWEIAYTFAGGTLGGRPADATLYVNGRASYGRMAVHPSFLAALRKLVAVARNSRIALLCAEADPLECHRFLLIGRHLSQRSVEVLHILPAGHLESQAQGERRLLAITGVEQQGLFAVERDLIQEAYERQEARVAFLQVNATFHGESSSTGST